jgi:uncharacterized protein (TIGR03067 family)
MHTFSWFVAASFLFCSFPLVADDKSDAELKALVGKWTVVKFEIGGQDLTEQAKGLTAEFHKDGTVTATRGKDVTQSVFKLSPSKSPKELDYQVTLGPRKGKTELAIYKLEGDTLVICMDSNLGKGDRPKKFETKLNDTIMLMTYKREKK